MRRRLFLLLCVVALCGACQKAVPDYVIQPDEMENLLYDYYLAQAMGAEFTGTKRYKQSLLMDYVFQKHHVDEATFDTSLIWYSRHPEQLQKIYDELRTRNKSAHEAVLARNERGTDSKPLYISGDTVDLWVMTKSHCLTTAPFTNRFTFSIPADTTFHEEDVFRWIFKALFVQRDTMPLSAVMELSVCYTNDSTASTFRRVSNGLNTLRLPTAIGIKEIRGQIYFKSDSLTDNISLLWMHELALMRYHTTDSVRNSDMGVPVEEGYQQAPPKTPTVGKDIPDLNQAAPSPEKGGEIPPPPLALDIIEGELPHPAVEDLTVLEERARMEGEEEQLRIDAMSPQQRKKMELEQKKRKEQQRKEAEAQRKKK